MLAEVYGETWLTMDLAFPCEIHPFYPRPSVIPNAKKILAVFTEPKENMVDNQWIRQNYQQYDLIVTYDRTLTDLPNVRLSDFGGFHCNTRPPAKDFSVSFILSTGNNKKECPGYDIRRAIALTMGWPTIPARLFLSSRRLALAQEQLDCITSRAENNNYSVNMIGDSKLPAFYSMFHIAIENADDDYYFTEKIMDCMRTYTVPIYWGTRRVLDTFDPEGIIYIDAPDKINAIIGSLTVEDYWKRCRAMAHNFAAAAPFADFVGSLRSLILGNINYAV